MKLVVDVDTLNPIYKVCQHVLFNCTVYKTIILFIKGLFQAFLSQMISLIKSHKPQLGHKIVQQVSYIGWIFLSDGKLGQQLRSLNVTSRKTSGLKNHRDWFRVDSMGRFSSSGFQSKNLPDNCQSSLWSRPIKEEIYPAKNLTYFKSSKRHQAWSHSGTILRVEMTTYSWRNPPIIKFIGG